VSGGAPPTPEARFLRESLPPPPTLRAWWAQQTAGGAPPTPEASFLKKAFTAGAPPTGEGAGDLLEEELEAIGDAAETLADRIAETDGLDEDDQNVASIESNWWHTYRDALLRQHPLVACWRSDEVDAAPRPARICVLGVEIILLMAAVALEIRLEYPAA